MQDHFLFDDNDPKQRGFGCDKLGTRKDGLALLWKWKRFSKKSGIHPHQSCSANVGGSWHLKVIFWHTNYEARVQYCDHHILSWDKDIGDDYKGEVLVTRLQAQFKAEQLLLDIWNELDSFIRKKKIHSKKVVRILTGGKNSNG